MKIGVVNSWYRPYRTTVNNITYTINCIHFYNVDLERIVCSSLSGWLEKENGGDITELELPVDKIKLKRKEDFDGSVFIISKGKKLDEIKADLYIPADMLNIHFAEYKIMYSTQLRAIYEGEQGIYITSYIKALDNNLINIGAKYKDIYKRVSAVNLSIKGDDVLVNIDRLKELAEEFIAEKIRVNNLTIDDIEI